MSLIVSALIAASLALPACTYKRNISNSITIQDYVFRYAGSGTETAALVNAQDPEDYVLTVTMPDGTTRTTASHESVEAAEYEVYTLAQAWVEENPRPTPTPAPTTSSTRTAGKNETTGE